MLARQTWLARMHLWATKRHKENLTRRINKGYTLEFAVEGSSAKKTRAIRNTSTSHHTQRLQRTAPFGVTAAMIAATPNAFQSCPFGSHMRTAKRKSVSDGAIVIRKCDQIFYLFINRYRASARPEKSTWRYCCWRKNNRGGSLSHPRTPFDQKGVLKGFLVHFIV